MRNFIAVYDRTVLLENLLRLNAVFHALLCEKIREGLPNISGPAVLSGFVISSNICLFVPVYSVGLGIVTVPCSCGTTSQEPVCQL